jgi:hypothetical protein
MAKGAERKASKNQNMKNLAIMVLMGLVPMNNSEKAMGFYAMRYASLGLL